MEISSFNILRTISRTATLWAASRAPGNSVRLQVSNYNNGSGDLFVDFTTTTYTKGVVNFIPTSTYADVMCWKQSGASNGFCDDLKLVRQ